MAGLNSWLSPDVMHALGWTLIHSLWQCTALAALAAALMAFSRSPSVRYPVALGALVAMLAAPLATFAVLMKSASPVLAGISPVASSSAVMRIDPGTFADFSHGLLSPNLLPWLVGTWFCGVALFSLRFAGGGLLLERSRRRESNAPNPRILAICRDLQSQLGLDRAIRYLECGWLQAPAVIGWFRPIVLLPVAALTGLSEDQLRAVIAHELAHIRRLDVFVNLFQVLVEILLFYHPAMWWLNKRIRAERELCCDEIAVSVTGNRLEYARALTCMAEWKSAPVLAMAANRGPLSQRVLYILDREHAGQGIMGLAGLLFLITALVAANVLLGIASPSPVVHADRSPGFVLSSGPIAGDSAVPQAVPANKSAAESAAAPTRTSRRDATDHETASLMPGRSIKISRRVPQPLQASERISKAADTILADRYGSIDHETANALSAQIDAAKISQAESPPAPSPAAPPQSVSVQAAAATTAIPTAQLPAASPAAQAPPSRERHNPDSALPNFFADESPSMTLGLFSLNRP